MNRLETYWSSVARLLWPALFGFAACAALMLWRGPQTLWIVAGIVAAAAVLVSVMAREGRLHLEEQAAGLGDKSGTLLTPFARAALAQLPDPLMLLDQAGRVLFANGAMYTVIGVA